ncbi:NusA-like transcription termination signal-binding factor [Candidatus Woesearchaeota archaeon]|nr:NusA-like transcription termination signal-binding factor [Candidatus Woesearchaeota archaeon]
MKITYTKELLAVMKLFMRVTGALLKDSFEFDHTLYFVVEPGHIGKAIGKGGSTVRELQEKFKKHVRVVEYNSDVTRFVQNLIYPLKVDGITVENGKLIIKSDDRAVRGQLIGRNAKNLNMLREVATRYFKISTIQVE